MSLVKEPPARPIVGSGALLDDSQVISRIFEHIDNGTTDLGEQVWDEPVANYQLAERLNAEMSLLKTRFTVFCPSLAVENAGDFVARNAAGVPLIAVRGSDDIVRVFRNACRHRGVQLAEGHGCKSVLVCPYHGWTYNLDGNLRSIPHQHGFPDFDLNSNGLVSVPSKEVGGLIYVGQDAVEAEINRLDDIPSLIPEDYELIETEQIEIATNWKLYLESALEGYHIRATHTQTFFPRQYDNLTVVESFGENSRVAFPYQSIEKLRNKPQEEWTANRCLTYVYHLFPNVLVSTFPDCLQVVVLEPITPKRTLQHTYLLGHVAGDSVKQSQSAREAILQGQAFAKAGAAEDQEMVMSAQAGLRSGANDHLTFGLFESAIGRLHAGLNDAIPQK